MVVELTKHVAIINQFSSKEAQKIGLAVDEAITNVIKHSYKYSTKEDILLEFFSSEKGLKIKIIFFGIPPVFDKVEVNLSQMIKDRKKGGLGMQLIKKIMDSVEYCSQNEINCCEMIKWKEKI